MTVPPLVVAIGVGKFQDNVAPTVVLVLGVVDGAISTRVVLKLAASVL